MLRMYIILYYIVLLFVGSDRKLWNKLNSLNKTNIHNKEVSVLSL